MAATPNSSATAIARLRIGFIRSPCESCLDQPSRSDADHLDLVVSASATPELRRLCFPALAGSKPRFSTARLLFAGGKDPLFATANALVCIQTFEHKFRCGNDNLRRILWLHADSIELLRQPLNVLQAGEDLGGGCAIVKPHFAAEIEELHDLLHGSRIEMLIEALGNRSTNQLACDEIGPLHFAFI